MWWTACYNVCVHCRSGQPHVSCEGPEHPHQGPEAEAPVSGGTSGTLPAGAQKALHQGGSKNPLSHSIKALYCAWIIKTLCHFSDGLFNFFFRLFKPFSLNCQELTGTLPSDYPLLPDEKPPRVRRRIGASFKLDEGLIHVDKEVTAVVYCLWDKKLSKKKQKNKTLLWVWTKHKKFFNSVTGFWVASAGNWLGSSAADLRGCPQALPGGPSE